MRLSGFAAQVLVDAKELDLGSLELHRALRLFHVIHNFSPEA